MNATKTKKTGIKIEGHRGTFYQVDTYRKNGVTYRLYESEQYGEDAPWVAVGSNGQIINDIYNGIDDLKEMIG